ncbi:MAG: uracil DNA glycosylase [Tremellales sp. Tagirdzhanova-0007]|nr:MAG: uracil DNA glycosylase [Tremellales sp. Tagirdzhanova-0007]
MPPQPARSISSYFSKPAATSATASTSASSTVASTATNRSETAVTEVTTTSTPTKPSTNKPGVLSEAARKAIEEGAAEAQASKKAKLADGSAKPKVADVFLKASLPQPALALPRASSRSELRTSLDSHPRSLALLELELDTLAEDWLLALQDELTKPYFLSLKEFIVAEQKGKKVFPLAADVYSWSRLCPLEDVRVVIIGQDPYHDDGQAHGLAFSVRKGTRIPPSLRNIYKQMSDDVPGFKIPPHGDLTEWAKHGVLLLNTSLTVRAHEAASHANRGWEQFTAAVIRVVTNRLAPSPSESHGGNGVVFMAWGSHAQKMCSGIDKNKHLFLRSAHPSPLAASKGFFGNAHFKLANEWLEKRYGPGGGIHWESLGTQS